MQSPDIFTEEFIVDELCDFLIAGTQTTQLTTQTVLSHFATDPESLSRIRSEFDQVLLAQSSSTSDEETMLKKGITMESCQELTYLGFVI